MPGNEWKRSLKSPKLYEQLREEGHTKEEAARISNAKAKKANRGGKKRK